MAESLASAAGAADTKQDKKRGKILSVVGSNQIDSDKAAAIFTRLENRKAEFKSESCKYSADKKSILADGKAELGVSKKVIRKLFQRYEQESAWEAAADELEAEQRDELIALSVALEGTPFGAYAAAKANGEAKHGKL